MHVFHNKFRMIFHDQKNTFIKFQKQPFANVFQNRCSYWKDLLKRESTTGFFFANIAKFFRTPILKNICERLLLHLLWLIIIVKLVINIGHLPAKGYRGRVLLRRFLDLARDIRILTGLEDGFCFRPLLNVYFSDMSINRWRDF